MRFLADQDVYALTTRFVRDLGHDVITAADLRLSSASDIDLLQAAIADRRILITRDRDFGSLIFVNAIRGGVIYLRMLPSTLHAVHQELERVLNHYDETVLLQSLIVVEPGRHRVRKLA